MNPQYPRMLYRDGIVGGDYVIVKNAEEAEAQGANGYFDHEQGEAIAAAKAAEVEAARQAEQKRAEEARAAEAKRQGEANANANKGQESQGAKPGADGGKGHK